MKIYTRIVMDMTQDDLPVVESEGYEYDGPVALCWGGRDSPEGGGGSAGATSAGGPGAGPGGGGLGGDGLGGNGGGWGDSPHGNPGGTRGPSSDAYGGTSGGLSSPAASDSVGTDRGGYMSSPHGNPHGIGLSHGQSPPGIGSISDLDIHTSQVLARDQWGSLPGWAGFSQNMGLLADTARFSGLAHTMAGLMTGNIAQMGYGAYQNIGYSAHMSDARAAAGMGPLGMPGGFGLDGGMTSVGDFGGDGFGSGTSPTDILRFGPESTTQAEQDLGPGGPQIDPEELEKLGSLEDKNSPMAVALDAGWAMGMKGVQSKIVRQAVEKAMQQAANSRYHPASMNERQPSATGRPGGK